MTEWWSRERFNGFQDLKWRGAAEMADFWIPYLGGRNVQLMRWYINELNPTERDDVVIFQTRNVLKRKLYSLDFQIRIGEALLNHPRYQRRLGLIDRGIQELKMEQYWIEHPDIE